jgi:spore maturation protein CgeB
MFYHSIISDWNHGNAHFLRGVVSELLALGHDVRVYEPRDGWSFTHYLQEKNGYAVAGFRKVYPRLIGIQYDLASFDLQEVLRGADLVIAHEWSDPRLIERLGRQRRKGRFRLLFHDTHHRAITDAKAMAMYDLTAYDGTLAFGDILRQLYIDRGWSRQAWTWHEAADTRVFAPMPAVKKERDLVWIGNWGDGERTEELVEFLIEPVRRLKLSATVYGVRYPEKGLKLLASAGISYGGWLPNFQVPAAFARHKCTIHIPRSPYVKALPGIPTIRPFEALACGIPLISSPWQDTEKLFNIGKDFVMVNNTQEMIEALQATISDGTWAREMAESGRKSVLSRHTCSHRVNELFSICRQLGVQNDSTALSSRQEIGTPCMAH